MNRRLLGWTALASAVLMLLGLLVLDHPLAQWLHASDLERLPLFAGGLGALDVVVGIDVWYWLAGWTVFAVGCLGLAMQRRARWPRVFLAAWAVQVATLATMIFGKDTFGRLRPQQVLDAGDWTQPLWFVGGGSFPSGHTSFYFGLLLPLAAACPIRWLRALLLAIPVYVALARIDLARHFLSDVAAAALIAALYALLLATLARRWLPDPAPAAAIAPPPARDSTNR
ncbi:MAG: phosphatase PAP2 family protein [Rhodanobacteraceae bacterium]|jgi:membrane-associated phospholipid phosphatase|nr:phosphatase PAP2 family protein [Rhodanobacteraceae bacterium]